MKRFWRRSGVSIWSRDLVMLAAVAFLLRFGEGIQAGARTNFFIDTMGLTSGQVMWLEGIREIPGLVLIFIAALVMHLPLIYRGAASLFIMGIGYALFVTAGSYSAVLVVAVAASLGFHGWMPVRPSLTMALATKERSGEVMGAVASVSSLAAIVGMGSIALVSKLAPDLSLRVYYIVAGGLIVLGGFLVLRLPKNIGSSDAKQPRMLIKKRYWIYYVLTFFEGARKHAVGGLGTLMLVQQFGLAVWQVSLLLLLGGVVGLICGPIFGRWIDRYGERLALSVSYLVLALSCIAYATIEQVEVLAGVWVAIRIAAILGMGTATYVNRIAPREELDPTLSAGVSINHVTSVVMPLIAGALLPIIGYRGVFLATAGLIFISIPFALAIRTGSGPVRQASPVAAE